MAKDREQAAADSERRIAERILKVAMPLIPAKHLDIWSRCRIQIDGITPSEVWRTLATDDRLEYDNQTSVFNHSKLSNKGA